MIGEIIAAVIGALVGGIISAYVAVRVARQQITTDVQLTKEQIASLGQEGRISRTWDIAFAASQVQSEILSAYTPDRLQTLDDILTLQREWGVQSRRLHLLGEQKAASELTEVINDYFDDLRSYVDGIVNLFVKLAAVA